MAEEKNYTCRDLKIPENSKYKKFIDQVDVDKPLKFKSKAAQKLLARQPTPSPSRN
jgi:hypothetical protein